MTQSMSPNCSRTFFCALLMGFFLSVGSTTAAAAEFEAGFKQADQSHNLVFSGSGDFHNDENSSPLNWELQLGSSEVSLVDLSRAAARNFNSLRASEGLGKETANGSDFGFSLAESVTDVVQVVGLGAQVYRKWTRAPDSHQRALTLTTYASATNYQQQGNIVGLQGQRFSGSNWWQMGLSSELEIKFSPRFKLVSMLEANTYTQSAGTVLSSLQIEDRDDEASFLLADENSPFQFAVAAVGVKGVFTRTFGSLLPGFKYTQFADSVALVSITMSFLRDFGLHFSGGIELEQAFIQDPQNSGLQTGCLTLMLRWTPEGRTSSM